LWGMFGDAAAPMNPHGSQASEAWAAGHVGSNAVYVGVIDEGVMRHADLAANLWVNRAEIAGNRKDDDRNGYVDDVSGWDFDAGNNTVYDGVADDHGTHVAGTIGAVGGNAIGVAGINWKVTIIPVKFMGAGGGTLANAIKSIDYLIALKKKQGINLVAINASWSGGGFSQLLLDAINRAGDAGILFVAAAGNGGADALGDNNDVTPSYPSNYECTKGGTRGWDCVIAVSAISHTGDSPAFSNFGAAKVDLAAPGASIMSTVPSSTGTSTYALYNGTSMAAPHVTGAAALYASTHLTATAPQIKAAIMANAVPTPSQAGRSVTGGRLNVSRF